MFPIQFPVLYILLGYEVHVFCIYSCSQERPATVLAVVLLGLDLVQEEEELIPLLVHSIVIYNWEIKSLTKNTNFFATVGGSSYRPQEFIPSDVSYVYKIHLF